MQSQCRGLVRHSQSVEMYADKREFSFKFSSWKSCSRHNARTHARSVRVEVRERISKLRVLSTFIMIRTLLPLWLRFSCYVGVGVRAVRHYRQCISCCVLTHIFNWFHLELNDFEQIHIWIFWNWNLVPPPTTRWVAHLPHKRPMTYERYENCWDRDRFPPKKESAPTTTSQFLYPLFFHFY